MSTMGPDQLGPDQLGPHRVRFSFDGAPLEAPRGMTIGGALLANGIVSWRLDPRRGPAARHLLRHRGLLRLPGGRG